MRYFDNPYANMPYRNKPWFNLTTEETSYIIYNAYRLHYLNSEDISGFVKAYRAQLLTYYAFPFVALGPIYTIVKRNVFNFRVLNVGQAGMYSLAGTAVLWWAFTMLSPFRRHYEAEKLSVLNYLDANVSMGILNFNNMLPRWWTENWVNHLSSKLYRRRNSLFTGILYPNEGLTLSIEDQKNVPTFNVPNY